MTGESRGSAVLRLRRAAGALLVIALLSQVAQTAVTAGPKDTKKKVEQTKEELQQAKAQVNRLGEELEEAEARLNQVTEELQAVTVQVSEATSEAEALAEAIYLAKSDIRRTGQEVEELQGRVDARARSAYIAGPATALELVLESVSLRDLSDRVTFISRLNSQDSELTAGLETEQEHLGSQRALLKDYLDRQRELLAALEAQRAELEVGQQAANEARQDFENKLAEAKDAVEGLDEKYREQLQLLIEQREAARERRERREAAEAAAAAAAAEQRGAAAPAPRGPAVTGDGPLYACPVDRPRSYVDDFGAPRVGHTHQGNDIFAPAGTPIRAPFAGTAEEGYDGLGGLVVHVYASANADYVYNAHLSRHAGVDGARVRPGDLIGYVGDTGNAQGTSPHDHFEYHPGGGSAVSPYVYLNEVCGVGGSG